MSLQNSLVKNLHWFIYPIFFLGCARQTTPTGGPKDSIPPRLVHSLPQHEQTNFAGKTVTMTFSETIILNNPREELIVTPALTKEVDIKAKKNQVELTFQEDLQPNTTYSLNFRETVQDITEKNPAMMLKIAFSTGDYIDSLSIEGNVYDNLTAKETKDATVCLYEQDTFDIFKHRPTYFTKTDDKGNFKIENLKSGTYYIYAIIDKNKNLVVDSKTEAYGFQTEPLILTEAKKGVSLPLVRLDSRPLKLTNTRPYGTYFNIRTTKNLTSYKLTSTQQTPIISSFGEDQSTIKVYNTLQDIDSIAVHFHGEDSINNQLDTTLYVKFVNREVKPEAFETKLANSKVIGTKGLIKGEIQFTKPISALTLDSIYYTIDSTHVLQFAMEDFRLDSLRNLLRFEKTFDKNLLPKDAPENTRKPTTVTPKKPTDTYQLYFGQSAFISIEQDSSTRISEKLTPSTLSETGIISIDVSTQATHFIVQLLSKDFQVLEAQRDKRKINFEDLKPGDYQIRLVIDRNNNGKWDPGNYYSKEQPEKVIFYRNEKGIPTINLKANWELGPLLIKE